MLHARSSNNPYDIAHSTLIEAIARIKAPGAGTLDFTARYIREVAQACDGWSRDVGGIVSDLAPVTLDYSMFDAPFTEIVEGNATYIAECAASAAQSERRVA